MIYFENLLLSHLLHQLTFNMTLFIFVPKLKNLSLLKLEGMTMEWEDFQAMC